MASTYDWSEYLEHHKQQVFAATWDDNCDTWNDEVKVAVVRKIRWKRVFGALFILSALIVSITMLAQEIIKRVDNHSSSEETIMVNNSSGDQTQGVTIDLIENLASEMSGDSAFLEDTPQNAALKWLLTQSDSRLNRLENISQRYALLVVFFSLSSKYDNEFVSPDIGECNWLGVTCNKSGLVTQLTLSSQGLVGSIPTEIGTLKSLRMLDLKDNEIRGDIPDEVGQLENLEQLFLQNNKGSLISTSHDGSTIDTIPHAVCELRDKKLFNLEMDCEFSGIDLCTCCTKCFPVELAMTKSASLNSSPVGMTSDDLSKPQNGTVHDKLEDIIRQKLSPCTNTHLFDISDTPQKMALDWIIHTDKKQLDGKDEELMERYSLAVLYFSTLLKNKASIWLDVENSACQWEGIMCQGSKSVTHIDLGGLGLEGIIPSEIICLSNLKHLDFANNAISGTIPVELASLSNLELLYLHENKMEGEVDPKICDLRFKSLEHFVVDCHIKCDCCTSCDQI